MLLVPGSPRFYNLPGLSPVAYLPPSFNLLPASLSPNKQVACILGAALVLFTSRSEGEGGSSYDAF